jgi:hypothetical protein
MKIFAMAMMILAFGTANAAGPDDAAADVFRALQKGAQGGNVSAPQKETPASQAVQTPRSAESDVLKRFRFYSEKTWECMAAELGGEGVYDEENCPKNIKSLQAISAYCFGEKIESKDLQACSQIRKEIEKICDDGSDFCGYL